MSPNPVLVDAWRGPAVESRHRGAIAIVDGDGHVVRAIGDVGHAVFPRSAIKVLQALPLVASGAADRYGLNDRELAVACASHGGQPVHTETVSGLLAKLGLDVDALECGTHWPYEPRAAGALHAEGRKPSALQNNCSGKHAGFVCLACAMADARGQDRRAYARGYVAPDHPAMREVTAAVAAATGVDLAQAPRGTDGCSIPTFAMPLTSIAHAFARVATGRGLSADHAAAAVRLRRAVAAEPLLVGGDGRFDSEVMARFGEAVFCKVGAEGVYAAALPRQGVGVAIKCDDGNTARAAEVAMAAVLEALLQPDADDARFLRERSDVTLRNWNRIEVGRLAASDALREALSSA